MFMVTVTSSNTKVLFCGEGAYICHEFGAGRRVMHSRCSMVATARMGVLVAESFRPDETTAGAESLVKRQMVEPPELLCSMYKLGYLNTRTDSDPF